MLRRLSHKHKYPRKHKIEFSKNKKKGHNWVLRSKLKKFEGRRIGFHRLKEKEIIYWN